MLRYRKRRLETTLYPRNSSMVFSHSSKESKTIIKQRDYPATESSSDETITGRDYQPMKPLCNKDIKQKDYQATRLANNEMIKQLDYQQGYQALRLSIIMQRGVRLWITWLSNNEHWSNQSSKRSNVQALKLSSSTALNHIGATRH